MLNNSKRHKQETKRRSEMFFLLQQIEGLSLWGLWKFSQRSCRAGETQEAQTEASSTPTLLSHWSQTDLSSVYIELSLALSAARMCRLKAQTLLLMPPKAEAWNKTVTSLSFDCKGLFTSPYNIVFTLYLYWLYFVKSWRINPPAEPTLVRLNKRSNPDWLRRSPFPPAGFLEVSIRDCLWTSWDLYYYNCGVLWGYLVQLYLQLFSVS